MTNLLMANSGSFIIYILLAVMLVGMVLFPMLSNKKRQKQYNEMQNALRPGTKIMTIGRMIGTIVKVYSDNTIELDVGTEGNPVIIVINREAVGINLSAQATPVDKKEKKEVAPEVSAPAEETAEVSTTPSESTDNPEIEASEVAVEDSAKKDEVKSEAKEEDDAI